ncbi:MAG: hypothetical protein KKB63_10670, partial [Alphaproteobacteria bacterium]|nr:hypothetical protein [Alphaproteobacteria bacterium]
QPPLQVTVSAEPIVIRDNKAVAVGLLIGEVLTASKGRGGRAVSLSINLARQDDKQLRLVMGVTGTLSPEGWEERGAQHFLEAFSRQMRGTLDIERNEAEVKVTLAFPYNNEL